MRLTFFIRFLSLALAFFLVNGWSAGSALASHDFDTTIQGIARSCNGSHCTIIDGWQIGEDPSFPVLDMVELYATLNMDTTLRAPANGILANCEAGETITLPIDASGEIIGIASAFYDSPPINFLPNGAVQAITNGLTIDCRGHNVDKAHCQQLFTDHPLNGTWVDSWSVSGTTAGTVQCSTNAAGTVGTCTIPPGTRGYFSIRLSRTVNNMIWKIKNTVGVMESVGVKPYGSMVSSVQVDCLPPPAPNLTVTATSLTPAAPAHNDFVSPQATILNNGAKDAAASVTRLRFDQAPLGSWDVGPFTTNSPTLNIDTTTTPVWPSTWQAPAGTHRLEVCADSTNVVAEEDENDNCRIQVFTVKAAPLSCTPITAITTTAVAATFTANGGVGPTPFYRWSAAGGSPATATGVTLATTYAATGSKTVDLIQHYVDVNGDGFITASDAQAVMNNVGGSGTGSGARWQNLANRFDVDANGEATMTDAQLVSEYILGAGAGPLPVVSCQVTVAAAPTPTATPLPESPSPQPTPATLVCPAGRPWYDVNGDNQVTQADSDAVTAALNSGAISEPGSGAQWQNPSNRFDVDGDGQVTPTADVLPIINYLNAGGQPALPLCPTPTQTHEPPPPPPPPGPGNPFIPGPVRETE